ncbi:MAG: hypothetical protein GDA37_02810 [Ekhidna sp.]|nr:hypothetical protein [Ekhidna sp.]
MHNLVITATAGTVPNLSGVTDMGNMFLQGFSSVTNMRWMFQHDMQGGRSPITSRAQVALAAAGQKPARSRKYLAEASIPPYSVTFLLEYSKDGSFIRTVSFLPDRI